MRILENLKPLSLLGLRLALGVIFLFHGFEKLARHLDSFPSFPAMSPLAVSALGVFEMCAGLLVLIGLITRLAALLLAVEAGLALARVELPRGGLYAVHNYQLSLAVCAAAFALATTGAGLLSLDAATFERGRSRPRSKSV